MSIEISVIIPVYNAAAFLEKAVSSVLRLPEVKEILLIEDGSTDLSWHLCKQLSAKDKRIQAHRHVGGCNKGAAASRNVGILKASCPYLAFLDADDVYLPNRFEADREVFRKRPEVDGVYNAIGTYYVTPESKTVFEQAKLVELTTLSKPLEGAALFENLIGLGPYVGYFSMNGLTVKNSSRAANHLLMDEALFMHEDTDFIIRLSHALYLAAGQIKHPVSLRGVHAQNRITHNHIDRSRVIASRHKLWQHLHEWATKNKISDIYSVHISRMKKVYEILDRPGADIAHALQQAAAEDPELLQNTDYYKWIFFHLHGKNLASKLSLALQRPSYAWKQIAQIGKRK